MVWEIKVCRKYIKILMSSSKTSVFPATKREAVTNCSDLGVSRERRGGQACCLGWAGGRCSACISARGRFGQCLWSLGTGSMVRAWESRYTVPALCWARSWCWQIINNDNDYESTVHVPLGLCKKTFTSKSNRNIFPLV